MPATKKIDKFGSCGTTWHKIMNRAYHCRSHFARSGPEELATERFRITKPQAISAPLTHSFEDILLRLQKFWQCAGCLVLQPFDIAVSAGIFHPEAFLRVLGPEPWRAVFVQPVRRPARANGSANSNRLQRFYQMQVIIKPAPADFPELCLQSLATLGVSPSTHKIRFVKRNWVSSAFGVRRHGQEVWIDNLKIARCSYFQEVGSLPAQPITGEITYGVERLAQLLQGCDNIFDILWKDSTATLGGRSLTYGDMHTQNENENSAYGLLHVDNDLMDHHFNDHERAAWELLDEKSALPIPAYELALKCAFICDILATRPQTSSPAVAHYVSRIGKLTQAVAREYLCKRQEAGFPLLHANFAE